MELSNKSPFYRRLHSITALRNLFWLTGFHASGAVASPLSHARAHSPRHSGKRDVSLFLRATWKYGQRYRGRWFHCEIIHWLVLNVSVGNDSHGIWLVLESFLVCDGALLTKCAQSQNAQFSTFSLQSASSECCAHRNVLVVETTALSPH